jgi:hypothetical protein
MRKFKNFVKNSEIVNRSDGFDWFTWNIGKWILLLIFIIDPLFRNLCFNYPALYAESVLWIGIMFTSVFLFCLFFCFIDVCKIFMK